MCCGYSVRRFFWAPKYTGLYKASMYPMMSLQVLQIDNKSVTDFEETDLII